MKTIGMLGGMSWESTVTYYRLVNERVKERLGGLHSAKIVLHSVDFHDIEERMRAGDWDEIASQLTAAASSLAHAGAAFVILCTNTMHRVAGEIEKGSGVPLLHIAGATAAVVRFAGIRKVGLLGTRVTMEHDFYRGRLEERGLTVVVPGEDDRELVHRVIFDELCLGKTLDASKSAYRDVIARLVAVGAEGVIFGCTEIGLLVGQADSSVPVFDTTEIHAHAAADLALA